ILSQNFIEDQGCLKVLKSFIQIAEKDSLRRIFKVLKTPLPPHEQPTEIRENTGYDLYKLNLDNGIVEDYTEFFNSEAEHGYWMKMIDLAYEINKALSDSEATHILNNKVKTRSTIYLAETSFDLSIQRNIIKRELERYGYKVLPEQALPKSQDVLQKTIASEMKKCRLSIHLIGNFYGEVLTDSEYSVVDIQHQVATELSNLSEGKSNLSRLIWISPMLQYANEKQRTFIESIKRETIASENTEILQSPLEDFKNYLREELAELKVERIYSKENLNSKPKAYIVHDKLDQTKVQPLIAELEKAGYVILLPRFKGDLLELREQHIQNLREFDIAVVYQDKVNDQWLSMKLLDLLKAPGFGRMKPIQGKALVSSKKEWLEVTEIKNQNLKMICGENGSTLNSLMSFLSEIKG
ncbi:MAG: DUF4062 domain-containing protein, partial [Cyclobacteriaceae bacterium]